MCEAAIKEALRLARAELRSGSLVKSLFVIGFGRFKSEFGAVVLSEGSLWCFNVFCPDEAPS